VLLGLDWDTSQRKQKYIKNITFYIFKKLTKMRSEEGWKWNKLTLELTPNQIRQSYGLDIDCKKEGLSEYYLAFFKKLI
jgi:hypothetical protein